MGFLSPSTPKPTPIPTPPPAANPPTMANASVGATANNAKKRAAGAAEAAELNPTGVKGIEEAKTGKNTLLGGGSK